MTEIDIMCDYIPTCGDTLYVRRPGRLSRMTAWATRGRREKPTLATHQAKFIGNGMVLSAEAGSGCVLAIDWGHYRNELFADGAEYAITSPKGGGKLTEHEQREVWRLAMEMVGWKYSHLELPLQLADGLLSKLLCMPGRRGLDVIVFRKLGDMWDRGVICSKTANRIDLAMKWRPCTYEYASPDDSWDYDVDPANDWRVQFTSEGWFRG